MGYGKRVEPEDVVVQLTVCRRAWTTVADSSVAVRAFAERIVTLQFSCCCWNVVDNPVMESSIDRCIVVGYRKSEALRSFGDAHPVEFWGNVRASTAEFV